MNQITHIGLDVHKDTIAVAVLHPNTTEVDERVIPNTSGGDPTAASALPRPVGAFDVLRGGPDRV